MTTRTWTGNGTDNNWATVANWGGTAPVNGDTLVFPNVSARYTSNNNIAGLSITDITIGLNTAYTFTGLALTLTNAGQIFSVSGPSAGVHSWGIDTTCPADCVFNISGQLYITGIISGLATLLSKSGSGTLSLMGANTYTGQTRIYAGRIAVNTLKSISGGNSSLGAPITIAKGTILLGNPGENLGGFLEFTNGVISSDRVIDLQSTTTDCGIINSSASTTTLTGGVIASGAGTKNLVFSGAGTGILSVAVIANNSGTNKTGVILNCSGTVALTGTQTYTGPTTVNTGTLAGTGTLATAYAEFYSGTKLSGTLTITNSVLMYSGSAVTPATAGTIGTLITGGITLYSGMTYNVDLNGTTPTFDKIQSTSTVSIGASTILNIASLTNGASAKVYTIISGSSVSGTFSGLPNGTVILVFGRTLKINYTGTTVTLTESTHRTWTGGGTDNNWGTAANWGGTAPTGGEALHFAGSTRTTTVNNLTPDMSFASFTFDASANFAFTFTGNRITLTTMLTVLNGQQMPIDLDIILASDVTILEPPTTGSAVFFKGILSGSGGLIINAPSRQTQVRILSISTYTGATVVNGPSSQFFIGLYSLTGIGGSVCNTTGISGTGNLWFGSNTTDVYNCPITMGSFAIDMSYTGSSANITFNGNVNAGSTSIIFGAGIFAINSTFSATGYTVASTTTLKGTGTIQGALLTMPLGSNIGPLMTGASRGTLHTASLTLQSGATFNVALDGVTPSFDALAVAGVFSISGNLVISAMTNGRTGRVYTIATASTMGGPFYGLADGTIITASSRKLRINYTNKIITLTDVTSTTNSLLLFIPT